MDDMEVVLPEEAMQHSENVNEAIHNVVTLTKTGRYTNTENLNNSQINAENHSTADKVLEEMQEKLQIGKNESKSSQSKSANNLKIRVINSQLNKGDGVALQAKSKEAVPSTSKVVVRRRARELRGREILRPILPRKSKEKARQMMKVIARGIIIPRDVLFQGRSRQKPLKKANVRILSFGKRKQRRSSKKSLLTVWARPKRGLSRSTGSDSSDHSCSCAQCSCHQLSC